MMDTDILYALAVSQDPESPARALIDLSRRDASIRQTARRMEALTEVQIVLLEGMVQQASGEIALKTIPWVSLDLEHHSPQIWDIIKGIVKFVAAVYDIVKLVADTIHLDLLITLGKIAYQVSSDFRFQVDRFFSKVSQVSRDMFGDAAALPLFFENIRALTLSTTSIFGEGYDIAEVAWVDKTAKFTEKIADNVDAFTYNPGQFLLGWADDLYRDDVDAAGAHQKGFFADVTTALENVITVADTTAELSVLLNKTIQDLPDWMQENIPGQIQDTLKKVNKFIIYRYNPTISAFEDSLQSLGADLETTQGEVTARRKYFQNPGLLVANINRLADQEKLQAERTMTDAAFREPARYAGALEDAVVDEHEQLAILSAALEHIPPVTGWQQRAVEIAHLPEREAGAAYESWFPGEY